MRRRIVTVAAILTLCFALLPTRPADAQIPYFYMLPNTGPTSGGINVTLLGAGFQQAAAVYFGGVPSPQVTVVDAGVISAAVPPGTGSVLVTVVNPAGQPSQGYSFTYTGTASGALAVSAISPSVAAAAGGTPVTITGGGFVAPVTVLFGGSTAISTSVVSSTVISATAPTGNIGASTVVVTSNGQSVAYTGFSYGTTSSTSIAITSVSPNTTPLGGGTLVQIAGSGFVSGASVTFGAVSASNPIVYSASLITAVAPAGPSGTVPIIVHNPNAESAVYTTFTYGVATTTSVGQPSVASVSPNSGSSAGGTAVTITGAGFSSPASVIFGVIPATNVSVVNAGLITVTTPANAVGAVTLLVGSTGGQVGGLTAGFTYLVAIPQVNGIAPASALPQGGTPITITGSGFVPGATVTVGGATATGVTVVSPTQITATTPAGPAGSANVLVINPGGAISGLANAFSYSTTAPTLTAVTVAGVSPSTGPITGGTSVTITGAGFASGATVAFGSVSATAGVISPTQIVAGTAPTSTVGAVPVTVANPGGGAGSLPNAFTYLPATPTTPPPPPIPPPPIPPTPVGPLVPTSGSGLFVFRGGSNADLVAASGCNAATAVFWTTDAQGTWIGFLPSVPVAIVNAAWNALFPNGIPANTAIFARCQ